MTDATMPMCKHVGGFSFNFFPGIGRRPVCHHLDLVELVARINSLIFLCIARSHLAIARRASVQFHQVLLAKIDVYFPVTAVSNRFLEQRSKCLPELRQIDSVLRSFWTGDARLHLR